MKKSKISPLSAWSGRTQRGDLHVAGPMPAAWLQPLRLPEGFVHPPLSAGAKITKIQQFTPAAWAKAMEKIVARVTK
jgi:hypothetical protein